MLTLLSLTCLMHAAALQVGDGKPYSRIEDAVVAAHPGDRIEVYPSSAGYARTAVRVQVPGIAIVAKASIVLNGEGFVYSGEGSVPRAIIQVNADDVTLEGFELKNAHNGSFNGAGIRVNAGSHVTIRNCDIHDCDMGIMSNGREGDPHAGEGQLYEGCQIHGNGSTKDPGYNHNLYLGGTSATLSGCKIWGSLTGHNLKSRAHLLRVEYCLIEGSANRECDLVEAWDTERAGSDAVFVGNLIVKDERAIGNRTVIHFGREKGRRNGTIYLINNTIVTPFASPVVLLSDPDCQAVLINNVVVNKEQSAPSLVEVSGDAKLSNVSGSSNLLSAGYSIAGTAIDPKSTQFGSSRSVWPFVGPGYVVAPLDLKPTPLPQAQKPAKRYIGDEKWVPTTASFMGAG